jgi:lipopolysaccharide transport system permease protein
MTETDRQSQTADYPRIHIRICAPKGWWDLDIRELWSYRGLVWILTQRDIKLRYKQTALGVIWVILQPLLASLIFAIVFGNLAKLPSDNSPYLLFVLAGMLPWNLFSQGLQRAGNSMISDSRLISKVYFPRMVIPIASAAAVLLDFAVSTAVFAVMCLIYGVPFSLTWLALVPLVFLTYAISVGASLLFSALNVYYRDFMYALPFVVSTWMYASPLVYSSSLVPAKWQLLYSLNPMTGIIEGFRWSLLGDGEFPAVHIGMAVAVGLAIILCGVFVFQRVERSFADVI